MYICINAVERFVQSLSRVERPHKTLQVQASHVTVSTRWSTRVSGPAFWGGA